MCENTAQTPGIQHRPIPVLFSLTKLEIAIFLSKIGVGFFHSSLANCMRPLMQNIQSILRGLTKEMFLLPSLVNGKLHHKLQTSFDNDTETKTEKIGLTFYLINCCTDGRWKCNSPCVRLVKTIVDYFVLIIILMHTIKST